ncbi:hypothetical protein RBH89_00570 [Paracidovorax avenae]
MGNFCCMPSRSANANANANANWPPLPSGTGQVPSANQSRSLSHAGSGEWPISPRSDPGNAARGFGDLPEDVQRQVANLLPRRERGVLRRAGGPALQQAIPLTARDAMHPIEAVHALLDIGPHTPADEVVMAVERGVAAARGKPWQELGALLAAMRHSVGLLPDHPEQERLLAHVDEAVQGSGLTPEQWRRIEQIQTMMLQARQFP